MDGIGSLCGLFPRLFRLAVNKESSVSDCFGVRNECIVLGVPFRVRPLEGVQYEELSGILANTFSFAGILRTIGIGSLPLLASSILKLSTWRRRELIHIGPPLPLCGWVWLLLGRCFLLVGSCMKSHHS